MSGYCGAHLTGDEVNSFEIDGIELTDEEVPLAMRVYRAGYKAGIEAAARKCENAAEHFGTIYARIIRATDA